MLVEAIESSRTVARVIETNLSKLDLARSSYNLITARVEDWLSWPANRKPARRYDLIIADPPYKIDSAKVLSQLQAFLADDGLLVLSHSAKIKSPQIDNLVLKDSRIYGDSALSFYTPVSGKL